MGNLICRIELHKKDGIIVTVENDTDQITQTMVLDGNTITTTCKGSSDTSIITQKPEGITIKCKDFLVDAETITCNSSKNTKLDSKAKTQIVSKEDFTIDSGSKFTATSTSDMGLTGSKVDIEGTTGDVCATGMNIKLTASSDATVDGLNVAITGSVKTEMAGAIINIASDGTLDVKGSMTTVDGSAVTTISGGLINLG